MVELNEVELEFLRAAPLPLYEGENGQLRIKLKSARGQSRWIDIDADQYIAIERIVNKEGQ